MCTSIGDIFNSVNKCENGAPYNARFGAIKMGYVLFEVIIVNIVDTLSQSLPSKC